ncbi:hypothetical protein NTE_01211 [Candidatus Nitrososphaera evergladensis SR1]|uniref:LPXTG cell wall anchor domain-containing protein n=1 Tax=Candidatus Nitrososphaera evergladensis SR1 TaxID=1459636 RepID=A0A075MQ32_9ARCH|nr:LPXTG cell wall anchor domain-containing protein [Candidatus Nitrososphaera evergladensis]AIF83283.1 hypothetical protein NTE_01211 [Candidatus Nitrososphaera evergladensis SR1]
MTATISFSGNGFDFDINMYGFTPGELVTIVFTNVNNSNDMYSIDTYVGYNPVHVLQQHFPAEAEGNYHVTAVGSTGTKAENTLTIGYPTVQGILPNTEVPLENITNQGGETVPIFGQLENIGGAAIPAAIPTQTSQNNSIPLVLAGGALLGGLLLISGGKKKVFA